MIWTRLLLPLIWRFCSCFQAACAVPLAAIPTKVSDLRPDRRADSGGHERRRVLSFATETKEFGSQSRRSTSNCGDTAGPGSAKIRKENGSSSQGALNATSPALKVAFFLTVCLYHFGLFRHAKAGTRLLGSRGRHGSVLFNWHVVHLAATQLRSVGFGLMDQSV